MARKSNKYLSLQMSLNAMTIDHPQAGPVYDLCLQHQYGKSYGGTNAVATLPNGRWVVFGKLHEGILGICDTPDELVTLLRSSKSWQTLCAEQLASRLARKPVRRAKRAAPIPHVETYIDLTKLGL